MMLKILVIGLVFTCQVLAEEDPPYELKLFDTVDMDINQIELECFSPEMGQGVRDAFFWLNGTSLASLTRVLDFSFNARIQFIITRDLEGDYTCGIQRDLVNRVESSPKRLVAFPQLENIENVPHPAASGTEARLPCTIQPGKLVGLYIAQWSTASGRPLVSFQFGMPLRNEDEDPDRYKVDPSDLSLIFTEVTPADAGDYICVLGVNGADRATGNMFYEQTRLTNITLVVFDPPVIAQPPLPQVIPLPENTLNVKHNGTGPTFQCTVNASQAYGTSLEILWMHNGQDVSRSEQYNAMELSRNTEDGVTSVSSQVRIESVGVNDNGMVRCMGRIPPSEVSGSFPVTANASTTLTVLGGFQRITSTITQEGHVFFEIMLYNIVPTEVRLSIEYTPTGTNDPLETVITSDGFINTDSIVYLERNPPVRLRNKGFTVKVALITPDLQYRGPLSDQSQTLDVRNRPLSTETIINIIIAVSVSVGLFVILAFVIVIVIVTLASKHYKRQTTVGAVRELVTETTRGMDRKDPQAVTEAICKAIPQIYAALKQVDSVGNEAEVINYTDSEVDQAVKQIKDIVRAGLKNSQMRLLVIKIIQELVDNVIRSHNENFLIETFKTSRCYTALYEEDVIGGEMSDSKLDAFADFMELSLKCLLEKKESFRNRFQIIASRQKSTQI